MGSQFSISVLSDFCSESVEILVEDSSTGSPSSFIVRIEYLFAFQFRYCELCMETDEKRREGVQKALFC